MGKRILSEYHATETDAFEYRLKIIFFTLAIFACYAAYASGVINVIWMALITTVLVTRWMINDKGFDPFIFKILISRSWN